MDIACPNCAATYRVPEALLAQGKPLRCVACGETWTPAAVPEPPPPEPPTAELPPPEPLPAEPRSAESPPVEPSPAEVAAASLPPEPPPQLPPDLPPDPPEASERPAPPTTPPPLNRPPLQRRPAPAQDATVCRSGAALRLAWGASIATVLLALSGLVFFSDAIAAAWPPFARVTALIGG